MENILKYYEFSPFFTDDSGVFSSNEISFTALNETHFLIFEKKGSIFCLYVSRYASKEKVGLEEPEALELLVNDYDKSLPEHRIILRKYLY